MHYILDPDMIYVSILKDAKNNALNREKLQAAFNRIQESDELFQGLFADVDLYSNRLGTGDQKRSATVAEVIKVLDGADLINTEGDVLGNAYEYLIGQFASETGKKAGEFYTPHGPAQILCRIAMTGQEAKKGLQVYVPCMGSGFLMLSCRNYSQEKDYIKYYGQELILKKHRAGRDILFIDASNLFVKEKKQNVMNEEHIDQMLEIYNARQTVEKRAYLASYEDIVKNDFNLNIPRYVDTSEEEIDLRHLTARMQETDSAIKECNQTFLQMLGELTFKSRESKETVEEFIKIFEGM